jgi:hypothetical protein
MVRRVAPATAVAGAASGVGAGAGRPTQAAHGSGAGLLALERTHGAPGDVGACGVRAKQPTALAANAAMLAGATTSSGADRPARRLGSQAADQPWVSGGEVPVDEQRRPSRRHGLWLRVMCRSASLDHGRVGVGGGQRPGSNRHAAPQPRNARSPPLPQATPSGRTDSAGRAESRPPAPWTRHPPASHHRLDVIAVPRRPVAVASPLQDRTGRSPVEPAEHLGHEGQAPVLGVEDVTVATHAAVSSGDLHERGRTVGQGRDPAGGGLAAGDRAPGHRFHTGGNSRVPGPGSGRSIATQQPIGQGPSVHPASPP